MPLRSVAATLQLERMMRINSVRSAPLIMLGIYGDPNVSSHYLLWSLFGREGPK